jgi:uncharacterized protein YggE
VLRNLACSLVLFSFALVAQNPPAPRFVRASGEAIVTAKPDRAQIDIGVITDAATADQASSQNATQTTSVLDSIRHTLGSAGELKTVGYSLGPRYDYSNGQAPRIIGYEARNTIVVTVDQLPLLGKIIDAATTTGANNINGISFTLRDDSAVRAQALSRAAEKARSNAEVLAKALGVQVVALLQAEPTEVPVRPLFKSAMPMAAGAMQRASTPVETGNLEVRATVTVTLEVR